MFHASTLRTERMCPVAEVFAASGGGDEELDWLAFEECMPTCEEGHAWAKPFKNFRWIDIETEKPVDTEKEQGTGTDN